MEPGNASNSDSISPQNGHYAVPIHQSNSSCSCKESLLVSGGFKNTWPLLQNKMCELRCIDDSKSPAVYDTGKRWKRFRLLLRRCGPMFSFNTSTIFLWGRSFPAGFYALWRYDAVSNGWTIVTRNNNFEGWGTPVSTDVVVPFHHEDEKLEMILKYDGNQFKSFILNLTTGEKSDSSMSNVPLIFVGVESYSAVVMGDVALVYGGVAAKYDMRGRLWTVSLSNCNISWTQPHQQE